jgi:2-oxoglutarate/2-oxoacid ferredoxin oxidoreductase subunit beta
VLRAAADHRGTAFIEIYQNCPIFNDDAFAAVKSPGHPGLIRLSHGEQVRFGPSGSLGLRFGATGSLEPVSADAVPAGTLITHDATLADPSYAFALSRLDSADFSHTPIGVFRSVDRPCYDTLMADQIADARSHSGDGDLATLLAGQDTWQVN